MTEVSLRAGKVRARARALAASDFNSTLHSMILRLLLEGDGEGGFFLFSLLLSSGAPRDTFLQDRSNNGQ